MLTPILLIGGSFAAGEILGDKLADGLGLGTDKVWSRRGIKIGVGVAAYLVIASIL